MMGVAIKWLVLDYIVHYSLRQRGVVGFYLQAPEIPESRIRHSKGFIRLVQQTVHDADSVWKRPAAVLKYKICEVS